jgi:SAM-dependent methyltransferase
LKRNVGRKAINMRSAQLRLDEYDTDKISNRYLERYDPILEPWLDKPIVLLELGVKKGGSLLLWHDYFPSGTIVGIDINLPKEFKSTDRIHLFEGSQIDRPFLSGVANKVAPKGFDIIIDDASHIGELTRIAFWHLFDNHLKPDGLYVIEDWGTGYWENWPDGRGLNLEKYANWQWRAQPLWMKIANKLGLKIKMPVPCHRYGMVGFIKQLVDEQGASDVTRQQWKGTPKRRSKFESLLITPSIVFVKKSALEPRIR